MRLNLVELSAGAHGDDITRMLRWRQLWLRRRLRLLLRIRWLRPGFRRWPQLRLLFEQRCVDRRILRVRIATREHPLQALLTAPLETLASRPPFMTGRFFLMAMISIIYPTLPWRG